MPADGINRTFKYYSLYNYLYFRQVGVPLLHLLITRPVTPPGLTDQWFKDPHLYKLEKAAIFLAAFSYTLISL